MLRVVRLRRRAVPTVLGPLPRLRGTDRQVTAAEGARLALLLHAEAAADAALVGWLRRIADAGTWLDLEQAGLPRLIPGRLPRLVAMSPPDARCAFGRHWATRQPVIHHDPTPRMRTP